MMGYDGRNFDVFSLLPPPAPRWKKVGGGGWQKRNLFLLKCLNVLNVDSGPVSQGKDESEKDENGMRR